MAYRHGHYVYALLDPWSKDVRYIGQTRQVKSRRRCYMTGTAIGHSTPLGRWLAFLQSEGVAPVFMVMLAAYGPHCQEAARIMERRLIQKFTNAMDGHIMLNVAGNPRMPRPARPDRSCPPELEEYFV